MADQHEWPLSLARTDFTGADLTRAWQAPVDDEWSVVETLRHLVFVVDAWAATIVMEEACDHLRHAERDLAVLESRS